MNKKQIQIVAVVIIIIVIAGIWYFQKPTPASGELVKIGIVTPLSGGVAYWGESTSVGIELAKKDLLAEGFNVEFVFEDGQLDPKVALNAAQKLTNIDKVDAIYSEFNPISIAVASFLKDKNIFHLYGSAAASPLEDGPYNFKTYLDYKGSCKDVSGYIKKEGIEKVGVLKMNLEHGDLCVEGIREVFGDNVYVESYNPGEMDYRTMINKLKAQDVDAIFHESFQPETLASLRQLNELGVDQLFVGLSETITPDVVDEYKDMIEGDVFFGLPEIDGSLKTRIDEINEGKPVTDYNAAGLAYVHMLQLVKAIDECDKDNECVSKVMADSKAADSIGFEGFENRIAKFNNRIVKFISGAFVEVK